MKILIRFFYLVRLIKFLSSGSQRARAKVETIKFFWFLIQYNLKLKNVDHVIADERQRLLTSESRPNFRLVPAIRVVSACQRQQIKAIYREKLKAKVADDDVYALFDLIDKRGFTCFRSVLSDALVSKLSVEFDRRERLKGQIWTQSVPNWVQMSDSFFCLFPEHDLVESVVEGISDEWKLFNSLRNCSDSFAFYSVNFFGSSPRVFNREVHYVQKKHRDYDAYSSIAFMVLLTSVSADNGATRLYDESTHEEIFLEGDAGDVFVFDTFNYHSGNPVLLNERRQIWIRFGEIPNASLIQDLTQSIW